MQIGIFVEAFNSIRGFVCTGCALVKLDTELSHQQHKVDPYKSFRISLAILLKTN